MKRHLRDTNRARSSGAVTRARAELARPERRSFIQLATRLRRVIFVGIVIFVAATLAGCTREGYNVTCLVIFPANAIPTRPGMG